MSDNCQDLDCLAGVRVVDFTQFEAGPSCTEALAWLGAEVVKIENPKTGDPARRLVPGKAPDDPWYFHMFNANKKSLAIDLKSPRGVHLVKELLKKADITVENMAPGTIDRLGLGYDEVRKLNPRIIYCSIQGFGAGSKYEKGLAFDMIAQAAGGMISVTGDADRPPVKPGPRFATGAARVEREAEVDAIITEWTRKHTKEEAMTLISGVGVPAGAVFDTMELQNDPSFEKRGIMQVMEHPNGPFKMPTWPVRVDGKPPRLTPSPLLGQHNAEVLNAWLGMA